jgi:hypothetical protein
MSKSRTEIIAIDFPTPGQNSRITTKPLDDQEAQAIADKARSLGHTATVRPA